jgi:hypothetical protein
MRRLKNILSESESLPHKDTIRTSHGAYSDLSHLSDDEFLALRSKVRAEEKVWTDKMRRALALGEIDPEDAKALGYSSPSPENWKELPKRLYHATTALRAIQREGLLTRDERSSGDHRAPASGLGGGDGGSISFTDDVKYARLIAKTFLLVHQVMNHEEPISILSDMAKRGEGADRPWFDTWKEWLGPSWNRVEAIIAGEDVQQIHGFSRKSKEEMEKEGWSSDEEVEAYPHYISMRRKLTPARKADHLMSIIKYWLSAWQDAGGPENPMFAFNDEESWLRMDAEDIGVIECAPKYPGMKGVYVPAESEWRVPFGDLIEVVGIIPVNESLSGFKALNRAMSL